MAKKVQSTRLTAQHILSKGVLGIFGDVAKRHDLNVSELSNLLIEKLNQDFPTLTFRHRKSLTKKEINEALTAFDPELGQTLFVPNASIIPDGGLVEVLDDNGQWRVVVVAEAKHQGKDIANIRQ